MGMAIYLVLEREVPEFDVGEMDGKSLARALPEKKGHLLSELENFISVTEEQRAEFLQEAPDIAPDTIPPPQWFDAATGLAAVRRILLELQTHPEALDASKSQHEDFVERVTTDLRAMQRGLQLAVEQGARFHLALDY
jgi:hypothetical protein